MWALCIGKKSVLMCPVSTAVGLVCSRSLGALTWNSFASLVSLSFVHTRNWKMKCEYANLIRSLMFNSTLKAYGCGTLKQTPLWELRAPSAGSCNLLLMISHFTHIIACILEVYVRSWCFENNCLNKTRCMWQQCESLVLLRGAGACSVQ